MPQNRVTDLISKFTRDWAKGFKNTDILRFFKVPKDLISFLSYKNRKVNLFICVTRPLKIHNASEQQFSHTSGMKEGTFHEF